MDSSTPFTEAAMDFLSARTQETLEALHAVIHSDPGFSREASPSDEVVHWRGTGEHQLTIDHLTRRMPAFFLSPSAHAMLATSLHAIGETERGENQLNLAGIALRTVMESGEGTSSQPWKVLRVADQLDTLELLEKHSIAQSSRSVPDGELDIHECADGFIAHFQVYDTP